MSLMKSLWGSLDEGVMFDHGGDIHFSGLFILFICVQYKHLNKTE